MTEKKIYKPKEFAKMIGVTMQTLRNWEKSGYIESNRTVSNRRYYTDEQYKKCLNIGKYEGRQEDEK